MFYFRTFLNNQIVFRKLISNSKNFNSEKIKNELIHLSEIKLFLLIYLGIRIEKICWI